MRSKGMFGKRPFSDGLANRVRQLSQRPPSATSSTPKARAERRPLFRNATLILANGQKLAVAITNLSSTGARIEFSANVDLNGAVTLIESILKLRRLARVTWRSDGAAGLKFADD